MGSTQLKKRKRITRMGRTPLKARCNCEKNINSNSPEGLGFCPKCQPLNVIMRGKDDNLWKIERKNNTKQWITIN